MANCGGIFQGQEHDCSDPLAVGITPNLYLANLDDVETITYSVVAGEENVITDITMKSGKSFFLFEGVNQSLKAQNELVRRSLSNGYKHQIDFSVFEVDNAARQNLQAMANKPQIGIIVAPDDSSLGNGAIEVYGASAGLDLVTNIRIQGDVETGGAYVGQLATPEEGKSENELPAVFFDTDYATTLAKVNALLTPAP